MFRNRLIKVFLLVALVMAGFGVVSVLAQDNADANVLSVDVAEDGGRFVFGQERLFEDGMPQYGTPFVTQGYIYPEGTLSGTNGVLANGLPEFPDLVLGDWTCYGYMIGDGARTQTGPWVISTQVYNFYGQDTSTIVTTGFELVDFDLPIDRAITGGTAGYRSVSGEQSQVLLGFTEQMGLNLRVKFQFDNAPAITAVNPRTVAPVGLSDEDIIHNPIYSWDTN